jgi:hypothetical protein
MKLASNTATVEHLITTSRRLLPPADVAVGAEDDCSRCSRPLDAVSDGIGQVAGQGSCCSRRSIGDMFEAQFIDLLVNLLSRQF